MTTQGCNKASAEAARSTDNIWLRVACSLVALAALAALVWGGWQLGHALDANAAASLIEHHSPALIGLPLAAGLATVVTATARALDGKIEFDLLILRAEGAAATGGIWIAVFLAVTLAVRALW